MPEDGLREPLNNAQEGNSGEAKEQTRPWVYVLLVVAVLVLGAFVYLEYASLKSFVMAAWGGLHELGLGTVPIVMLLCWALTAVSGPVIVIEVAAGALYEQMYGPTKGALVALPTCCIGIWLGCITAFVLGRKFFKDKVQTIIDGNEALRVIDKVICEEGWKFAFLMRLNPLIPFELVNYAVAMTNISFEHNAIAALGTMPIVCFEVYSSISATALAAGAAGGQESGNKMQGICIKLGVSLVLIGVVAWYGKKKYDEKVNVPGAAGTLGRSLVRRGITGNWRPTASVPEEQRL